MFLSLVLAGFVGHLALLILAINVLHGSGWKNRYLEPLSVAGLAVVGLLTLWVAWELFSRPVDSWHWGLQSYGLLCLFVGTVSLPVGTFSVLSKRLPDGIQGTSGCLGLENGEPRALANQEKWIGNGRHAWLLRLPGNQALQPILNEWQVPLQELPPELASLRILHLTDLHLAPCFDRSFFEAIFAVSNQFDPDLVLLTGDIVEHPAVVDWIKPLLSQVRGRLGQFAILGNHDYLHDDQAVRDAVVQAGFQDVDGAWVTLQHQGRVLAIGGTSAPWGPLLDRTEMPKADFRIVLSHTPDLFYQFAAWDSVDLMLCGHNHGGQVRLPLIGPILMPSRYSRRFDRGFFKRGRTLMYVSQGLGAKHPVRWNCPPEVTQFVLRPVRRNPAPRIHQHVKPATLDLVTQP